MKDLSSFKVLKTDLKLNVLWGNQLLKFEKLFGLFSWVSSLQGLNLLKAFSLTIYSMFNVTSSRVLLNQKFWPDLATLSFHWSFVGVDCEKLKVNFQLYQDYVFTVTEKNERFIMILQIFACLISHALSLLY